MKIIYNPANNKIYRVIKNFENYKINLPFEVVYLEAFSNKELIALLLKAPQDFTYNSKDNTLIQHTEKKSIVWTISERFKNKNKTEFVASFLSLDEMIKSINKAKNIDDVKEILVTIVKGYYVLADEVIN